MTDRFGGALLDLRLHVRAVVTFVDEDSKLTLIREKSACRSLPILFDGQGLHRQLVKPAADEDPNEPEQASRGCLGSVLHLRKLST